MPSEQWALWAKISHHSSPSRATGQQVERIPVSTDQAFLKSAGVVPIHPRFSLQESVCHSRHQTESPEFRFALKSANPAGNSLLPDRTVV